MNRNEATIARKYRKTSDAALRALRDAATRDGDAASAKWFAARDRHDMEAMKCHANDMNTHYDVFAETAFILTCRNANTF
jgi:hypothetical protein